MTPREGLARVLHEAEQKYIVQGTSKNDHYSSPHIAPWFVIDGTTAEPEVNWPGELINQFNEWEDARRCRRLCIIDALLLALREPTAEQLEAGRKPRTPSGEDWAYTSPDSRFLGVQIGGVVWRVEDIYQAMIDVLREGS